MKINESNRPIGIGAIAGTATGAVAGIVVGNRKSDIIMGDYKRYSRLSEDSYVSLKSSSALEKLKEHGMTDSYIKKNMNKIVSKAKSDYPVMLETAKKLKKDAAKTKSLYILGLSLACLAIGTGIGLIKSIKKDDAQ